MKETLEKLWYDYLIDECSTIDTDEERNLTRKAAELYKEVKALLNKEQQEAVEKYISASYELESFFTKKAFFKGCEFAVSFLLEAQNH